MTEAPRVAVIGAGLIGRAWAITFARGGVEVALHDAEASALPAALDYVDGALVELERNALLAGQAPGTVRDRIRAADSLADALAGAGHVQECTAEDAAVKRAVFAELDAAADPGAVLASSTSGILPSSFTEGLAGRARCLVAHPINPPYLVPAVEVVPAPWTDPDAVERTRALLERIGQAPIVMRRELEGFVMNRMQGALLHEAFRLVASGAVSAEDVDRGLRDGIGLRWSFMGPFETIDLNAPGGVRDYVERYGPLYHAIAAEQTEPAEWSGALLDAIEGERREALAAQALGERQLWRDRRLMALVAHKRARDAED